MIIDPTSLAVFGFAPNEATEPILRLRALTEIRVSDAGREERNARLRIPALGIKFEADTDLDYNVSKAIEEFLRANIGLRIVVPLWSEQVVLTGPVDDVTIPCDSTTQRLFSDDRPCILWHSPSQCEVVVPATGGIGANSVTASEAPTGTYVAGDLLIPAIVTEPLTEEQTLTWLTSFYGTGSVDLQEAVESAVALPWSPSLPEYAGIPIFPFPFNEINAPESVFSRANKTLRNDADMSSVTVLESETRISRKGEAFLDTRTSIITMLALFADRLGRYGRFWLPSSKFDLLLGAASTTGTTLDVVDTGFADLFAANRFAILVRSGAAWHARRIAAVIDLENGYERLTLDSSMPSVAADAWISLLHLVRSEQDDIELAFTGTDLAETAVDCRELPLEYIDLLPTAAAADGVVTDDVLEVAT